MADKAGRRDGGVRIERAAAFARRLRQGAVTGARLWAPRTTEAFARAHESAGSDKDAPERLATDYGLWIGNLVRGDLPAMRAHAAAFVSIVDASPDSPEAGVAHRLLGTTHWFTEKPPRSPRDQLERALAATGFL